MWNVHGCLRDADGNLLHIRTDTHLIPARKVSYIEKVWEKDGVIPKGIRIFFERPFPQDLSALGTPVDTVYIWMDWKAGGKEVWETW